jgi:hypothetical protein
MHADQVIDLQFYRLNSENECEADVGNPPGYLVIEVQNGNSTDYDEIPSIDITYVENTTTSGDCSNTQCFCAKCSKLWFQTFQNKTKNKKYLTIGTILKCN